MMYPRKYLDIGMKDLGAALLYCLDFRLNRTNLIGQLDDLWSHRGDALVALSVRSAFDALLSILNLSAGSEVIMSGINIPDMTNIVLRHNLKVVPVDISLNTLQINADQLAAAITPKTRVVVMAHLFGSLMDMQPVNRVVREHDDILLVEDCAQAFTGCSRYLGADQSDVSMFSFGAIKTATALGGAMVRVRSPDLRLALGNHLAAYPLQRRSYFLKRVLKYMVLKALSYPRTYGATVRVLGTLGVDHDEFVVALMRTFPGRDLLDLIRLQPSTPLLALLLRRLQAYRRSDVDGRISAGREVVKALDDRSAVPGADNPSHTFWLFPLLTSDGAQLIDALRRAGFDAAADATQLHCVGRDPDHGEFPEVARTIIDTTVYLPVYGNIPKEDLARMISIVQENSPAVTQ